MFEEYWKPILLATGIAGLGNIVIYVATTYSIAFMTTSLSYQRDGVLNSLTIATII